MTGGGAERSPFEDAMPDSSLSSQMTGDVSLQSSWSPPTFGAHSGILLDVTPPFFSPFGARLIDWERNVDGEMRGILKLATESSLRHHSLPDSCDSHVKTEILSIPSCEFRESSSSSKAKHDSLSSLGPANCSRNRGSTDHSTLESTQPPSCGVTKLQTKSRNKNFTIIPPRQKFGPSSFISGRSLQLKSRLHGFDSPAHVSPGSHDLLSLLAVTSPFSPFLRQDILALQSSEQIGVATSGEGEVAAGESYNQLLLCSEACSDLTY
eukprot:TRINITY_DN11312_c0_g1_i1.p1 TRINITY_DN11312_c0_g1~~TRINITY_DN11312_c0_g1_i1.p1  ORF type:complete len:266 (+),score=38.71 TRINITY_DN11312_c0_g1_i1:3-800(+)